MIANIQAARSAFRAGSRPPALPNPLTPKKSSKPTPAAQLLARAGASTGPP